MADLSSLRTDKNFLALKPMEQLDVLRQASPDFAAMSPEDQQGALADFTGPPPENALEQLKSAATAGPTGAVAGLDHTAANAFMILRKLASGVAEVAPEVTGGTGDGSLPALFQSGEDLYRSRSQDIQAQAESERRPGLLNTVGEVTTGLPLNLLKAAAAYSLGGPVLGFGGLGVLETADRGAGPAAVEGVKGMALGKVFQWTDGLHPILRALGVGIPSFLMDSDEDMTRRVTNAVAMGSLASLGGHGKVEETRAREPAPADAAVTAQLDHLAKQPEPVESETGGPSPESTSPPGAPAPGEATAPESTTPMTPEQVREQFGALIGPKDVKYLSNVGDSIRQGGFDDAHGQLMRARQLGIADEPDNAYELQKRVRGASEIGFEMLKRGIPREITDEKTGGKMLRFEEGTAPEAAFADLLEHKTREEAPDEVRDAINYAIARRSKKLLAEGREALVSPELVEHGLSLETPARKTWFDKIRTSNERVLDLMEAKGLINKDQRAGWSDNEFTFSYFRDLTGDLAYGGGGGSMGQKAIQRLGGSERNLRDPMVSMVGGMAKRVQLALENEVRQKTVQQARAGEHDPFIEKLEPSAKMVEVHRQVATEAIMDPLERAGDQRVAKSVRKALERDGALPDKLWMFAGEEKPFGRDVMTVYFDGKPEYYRIKDPVLLRSIESISRKPIQNGVLKFFNSWRRLTQEFTTSSPTFIIRNGVRDPIASSVMTQTGNQHLTGAMRGLLSALREDQNYQDFIANGGGGGTLRPDEWRTKVIDYAGKRGISARDIIALPADAVRALNEIGRKVELGPRVGEFIRAREQGHSAGHSSFLGREVTTDYAQHGDKPLVQLANSTIPFFSSMLASSDRFYRAVREPNQRAAAATKMGMVMLLSTILHALNQEDPDFDKLPDWDKNGYWHIPRGKGAGWYRIPKAWEVGALGSIAERTYDSLTGSESTRDQSYARDVLSIAKNLFNVGLPVGVQQAYEQTANQLWYTGDPIEPHYLQQEHLPWDRATSGTSPTLRGLYKEGRNVLPGSPARADALLRGLFSYGAEYGLWASDHLFFPGQTNLNWDDEPVLGSFVERPGHYNRYRNQFYELLDLQNQIHGTMMSQARGGDPEVANELGQLIGSSGVAPKQIQAAARYLSAVNKEIQLNDADETLDAETKKQRHNDKVRERDAMMEQVVRLQNRMKGE